MIATGGGDSAIRVWFLQDEIKDSQEERHFISTIPPRYEACGPQSGEEVPRMVGLLHDTSALVITDKGCVIELFSNVVIVFMLC